LFVLSIVLNKIGCHVGTIAKGAALLHQEGAREVYACTTHAVFRYNSCYISQLFLLMICCKTLSMVTSCGESATRANYQQILFLEVLIEFYVSLFWHIQGKRNWWTQAVLKIPYIQKTYVLMEM